MEINGQVYKLSEPSSIWKHPDPFHPSMLDSAPITNVNTSRRFNHPSNMTTLTDTPLSSPPPPLTPPPSPVPPPRLSPPPVSPPPPSLTVTSTLQSRPHSVYPDIPSAQHATDNSRTNIATTSPRSSKHNTWVDNDGLAHLVARESVEIPPFHDVLINVTSSASNNGTFLVLPENCRVFFPLCIPCGMEVHKSM